MYPHAEVYHYNHPDFRGFRNNCSGFSQTFFDGCTQAQLRRLTLLERLIIAGKVALHEAIGYSDQQVDYLCTHCDDIMCGRQTLSYTLEQCAVHSHPCGAGRNPFGMFGMGHQGHHHSHGGGHAHVHHHGHGGGHPHGHGGGHSHGHGGGHPLGHGGGHSHGHGGGHSHGHGGGHSHGHGGGFGGPR